jgi:carboxyl-terminal processing protease
VGTARSETQAMIRQDPADATNTIDMAPVWDAWRLLDEKYVSASSTDVTTPQDRVWGMISGLASSYGDPYTAFMPPLEAESFEQEIQGSFGGIGAELGIRNEMLTVVAPLKGTPAEESGLLAGDVIMEIDKTSTQNMSIDEAIHLIRGEVGTVVVLTIARMGDVEPRTVSISRAIIDVPTLETEKIGDDVFRISIYTFNGIVVREMRTALREFVSSGRTRLILDLRGNPGGYLEAAVDIASWFLPAGTVVVTEDYGPHEDTKVHRANGNTIHKSSWRIAVLVDGGSASATEILAGALSEHGKAVLIGTQTYGKGSVQEVIDLTPDTSLKITVARWLTPKGVSLSHTGLTPDFVVKRSIEDYEAERDPQLDVALEYVRTGVLPEVKDTASSTPGVVLE